VTPRHFRARWPLEDRIGWSALAAGVALTWTALALLGGLDALRWALGICAWLILVAIGGITGGGR
jgi:hypothetical protein